MVNSLLQRLQQQAIAAASLATILMSMVRQVGQQIIGRSGPRRSRARL